MNVRKLLHSRFVSSIENLHSSSCNDTMLAAIRGGMSTADDRAPELATILEAVRRRGTASLDQIRLNLSMSGRAFEKVVLDLIKLGHARWVGDCLVVAPFAMLWNEHRNGHRYNLPQPASQSAWCRDSVKRRILTRPFASEVITELSPHWIARMPKDYLGRLGRIHKKNFEAWSLASQLGCQETTVGSVASNMRDINAEVGSVASSSMSHPQRMLRGPLRKVSGPHKVTPQTPPQNENDGCTCKSGVCGVIHKDSIPVYLLSSSLRSLERPVLQEQRKIGGVDLDPPIIQDDSYPAGGDQGDLVVSSVDPDNPDLDSDGLQIPMAPLAGYDPRIEYDPYVNAYINEMEEEARRPRARRKRSEAPVAGEQDHRFVAVWLAHRALHEKWDENGVAAKDGAFSMAGAGSRSQAWLEWQKLSLEQRTSAFEKVAITLAWRAQIGLKSQQAVWYIKDRSWARVPSHFSLPSPTALHETAATPASGAAPDYWVAGLRHFLKTGSPVLIPGNRCPTDWAAWPHDRRAQLADGMRRLVALDGETALAKLKDRSPAAEMYMRLIPVIAAPAPVDAPAAEAVEKPEAPQPARRPAPAGLMRTVGIQSAIKSAARGAKFWPEKPKRGTFSQEQLAAYCADVGLTSTRH